MAGFGQVSTLRSRPARAKIGVLATAIVASSAIVAVSPPTITAETPTVVARPTIPDGQPVSVEAVSALPDAAPSPVLDRRLASTLRGSTAATTRVEIVGEPDAVADAVSAAGGTLERGGGGLYSAVVPTRSVQQVASASGVGSVRSPGSARPTQPTGRAWTGATQTQASAELVDWHRNGYQGDGVKVGLFGYFDPVTLTTQIATGELPAIPDAQRRCVNGPVLCPFGTNGQHFGVALAQMVVDAAPGAGLYLAEPVSLLDYYPIIDWMAANGVRVVVNPLIFGYDGAGDGTGPAAAVVDYAAAKGLAWLNMAGEFAANPRFLSYNGGYWRGTWSDPDNDRWLNFSGSDEVMGFNCSYFLGLRWSDFGATTKTDYDLYANDFNASTGSMGVARIASANNQTTAGVLPLEANGTIDLCNTNSSRGPVFDTNNDGFIGLRVQRKSTSPASGAAGDILELASYYGYFEYATSQGSVGMPFADSKNRAAATVGGDPTMEYPNYGYPSWGPTNDGRIKPDFVTSACTAAEGPPGAQCSGGWYYGTDGSAASAAGFAAVAIEALDIATPWHVVRFLRDNTKQLPYGPPNSYGYGRVGFDLPPAPQGMLTHYRPLPQPIRVLDTRTGVGTSRIGPLMPDETRSFIVGEAEAVVLNVAMVQPTSNGFVSVFPHGSSYPGAIATLNVQAGVTRSNLVIVPAGRSSNHSGNRDIDVYTQGGGHVVIDLVGRMAQPNGYDGRYRAVAPTRVLDSTTCLGLDPCSGAPLPADSFTPINFPNLNVPGLAAGTVPAGTTAVALSVTVSQPAANGYLSAVAGDSTNTSTSTLNYMAGLSASSLAIVRIDGSAAGTGKLFLKRSAHLQVDLLGWFTGPGAAIADEVGLYRTIQPTRLFDSRRGGAPPLAAGSTTRINTVPHYTQREVMAAFVNIASAQSTAAGAVEAGAGELDGDHRSLSLPVAGQAISAAAMPAIGGDGFNLRPTSATHLIADSTGYFIGAPSIPTPGSVVRVSQRWDGSTEGISGGAIQVVDNGNTVLFVSGSEGIVTPEPVLYNWTYVWSRSTNTVINIPGGQLARLNAAGTEVAFGTADSLVPEDTDTLHDVYIMRLDGSNPRLIRPGGQRSYGVYAASEDLSRLVMPTMSSGYVGMNVTTGATVTVARDAAKRYIASEDGTTLLAYTSDERRRDTVVEFHSLVDGSVRTLVMRENRFQPHVLSADGTTMAGDNAPLSTLYSQTVAVDVATGRISTEHMTTLRVFAIGPEGKTMVHWDGLLRVRDLTTGVDTTLDATWNGEPITTRTNQDSAVMSANGRFVAFLSNSSLLNEATSGPHLYLRDLQP